MAKTAKELDDATIKLLTYLHGEGLDCAEALGVMIGAVAICLNEAPREYRAEALKMWIDVLKAGVFPPLTVASSK